MLCSIEAKTLEKLLVMSKHANVSPEELPVMPADRDIEFITNLLPGTEPITKRSYWMSVDELEELRTQLKELFDKGFIRLSDAP